MPPIRNQADERAYYIGVDQHGREWESMWDLKARRGGTCAPINPKGWTAPILPPPDCIEQKFNEPNRFTINYSKWLHHWRTAEQRYTDESIEWAQRMKLDPDHPDVKRMVGRGPFPIKIIQAAQAGNRWALGLVPMDRVPTWAEEYKSFWATPAPHSLAEFPDLDDFPDAVDTNVSDADLMAPTTAVKRGPGRPRKSLAEVHEEVVA